jgi:hypothetical protein
MSDVVVPNQTSKRQRKFLSRLEDFGGASSDAIEAVLNLVNPFPDEVPKRVGWPDSQATPSVVIVDTYEVSLSAPAGIGAGLTWDVHAAGLPFLYSSSLSLYGGSVASNGVYAVGTTNVQMGGLVIVTNSTGQNLDPIAGSSAAPYAKQAYGPGAQLQGSQGRIVAQGIEIVNTSAELYRGGMAYAYRIPAQSTPMSLNQQSGLPVALVSSMLPYPPAAVSDIVNYPNTFEGMAANGVYAINTPNTIQNQYKANVGGSALLMTSLGNISNLTLTATQTLGLGSAQDWCYFGSFLTGLAQGASVLVRYRTYLEVAPTPRDGNNLVRLLNPSVPHNPAVTEVLDKVLVTMPAGCSYTDNPLGEWFDSLMNAIESAAPSVGSALGMIFPPAKLIANGIGMAAGGARQLNVDSRAKAKAKSAKKTKPVDGKSAISTTSVKKKGLPTASRN